jgi:hypothetical protein
MPNGVKVDGDPELKNLETRRQEGVWQLVPYIYDMKHTPEDPTEYDFRENGYWHICKALQMFPADPRFEYDNYNDATKYRTTGELMEVSRSVCSPTESTFIDSCMPQCRFPFSPCSSRVYRMAAPG